MKKPNYTPEIRERAVQLLIESEKDYPSTWAAITAIAPKIGCTPETLRVWYLKHMDQLNPAKVQQISDQEKMNVLTVSTTVASSNSFAFYLVLLWLPTQPHIQ